jgi:hypothetical protein
MYKGVHESSRAVVGTKVFEFNAADISTALLQAIEVGKKKEWRVALIAEVNSRTCPKNKWDDLLRTL